MTAASRRKDISFKLAVDSCEQRPYTFTKFRGNGNRYTTFETHRISLPTADYASTRTGELFDTSMPSSAVAIVERKSLADLYKTLASRREAFIAEMKRASFYGYAAVVIEAPLDIIFTPNYILKHPTKLNPRSVIATLLAISQRYGVHVWPCPDRSAAEQVTFRMLERWVLDNGNHHEHKSTRDGRHVLFCAPTLGTGDGAGNLRNCRKIGS